MEIRLDEEEIKRLAVESAATMIADACLKHGPTLQSIVEKSVTQLTSPTRQLGHKLVSQVRSRIESELDALARSTIASAETVMEKNIADRIAFAWNAQSAGISAQIQRIGRRQMHVALKDAIMEMLGPKIRLAVDRFSKEEAESEGPPLEFDMPDYESRMRARDCLEGKDK